MAADTLEDCAGNGNTAASAQVQYDPLPPTLTIDMPAENELHIASTSALFTLEGHASDACTGVGVPDIKIGSSNWAALNQSPGTWNSGTGVWTYVWDPDEGVTDIGMRVTDGAGNTTEVHRKIEVTIPPYGIVYVRPHDDQYGHDGDSWQTAWDTV